MTKYIPFRILGHLLGIIYYKYIFTKGGIMNLEKLKRAESIFFQQYPLGFEDPELEKQGKKHKMPQLIDFAHDVFSEENFMDRSSSEQIESIVENSIRLVSKSSMVSLFEKPKYRDTVRNMSPDEKITLVEGLYELIHGNEEMGFNMLLTLFTEFKLAKWTLITVFRCYYYPDYDLLFKPTTVKNIIKIFELEDLVYKPRPSYDFFVRYRKEINDMKNQVDPSLSPNNPAFSGFLMMTMEIL